MKRLNRKDLCVLLVAMAMTMPVVLVFNGNPETWYINVFAMVYLLWLVRQLQTTKIGRKFTMRLGKIEDKIFGMPHAE